MIDPDALSTDNVPGEVWVAGIALAALSLASMSVRKVASLQGVERSAYIASACIATLGGVLIAMALPTGAWAFGGVVGLASVELGPTVLGAARKLGAAIGKRFGGDA